MRRAARYQDINVVDSFSDGGTEWDIEKVLAKRVARGVTAYYVKWLDWDDSYNEWLPESVLSSDNEKRLIQEFLNRLLYL